MTRQEAIEVAAELMNGTVATLEALGAGNWGKLAELVLDKTGRTDLADAIWEGR